jgi:hypothetical protein
MSTGILPLIKQAALDAVENKQMCDLRYGEVIGIDPLRIKITNQFIIPGSMVAVPHHLTKYNINFDGTILTVDNSLRLGDWVALLRKQGGQSYFILDRVSDFTPSVSSYES